MVPGQGQRPVYASAGWEIDLARRELRSSGVPVPLGGRAFEIVAELVQSGGELVSKTDLAERVWPRTFVEEGALRVHIAAIRKAFGRGRADAGARRSRFDQSSGGEVRPDRPSLGHSVLAGSAVGLSGGHADRSR